MNTDIRFERFQPWLIYLCTVDVGYKHTGYKNISDIRTLYLKTVAIYPYIIYAGYKNIYAVPDDVLITGIQCITEGLV